MEDHLGPHPKEAATLDLNLKMGLHHVPRGNRPAQEFAQEFEQKATDTGVKDKNAKATLITLLNEPNIQVLDQYIILRGEVDSANLTAKQHLNRVLYK